MKKESIQKSRENRPPYLRKLILAFILATVIFIGVFILANTIAYNKYQDILHAQEELRYDLLSFEIENELIGKSCDNFNPYRFSDKVGDMQAVIEILEERFGKTDSRVLEQKKIYSLLEVQHFLYIKEHNLNCEDIFPTILFFYSNQGSFEEEAEKIGRILTSLKKQKPDIMIYSFDYDIDASIVSLLKQKYNVSSANSLVLDEGIAEQGLDNIDDLPFYLN